jgi:hypothetical protein
MPSVKEKKPFFNSKPIDNTSFYQSKFEENAASVNSNDKVDD